ncbi:phage tail fiber assembly [Xenorhabdus beddingii]|uniref:Phage tail fiber assembly n=1 Tax=Xenorhabdus beddingii TaxID=40578 RepID=A0A1Y2SN46_9GAMM|nr:tail fiber assembly protein [Xenorhabdus beddingii]OTA20461.1 phage tail fiber assembly [Xenorhabdus beddingii]
MMAYFYSAVRNSFYPTHMKQDYINVGSWPDDGIEVSETIFNEFAIDSTPEGKYRIAGSDGLPAWADIPPPTPEQLQQNAEHEKRQLLRTAAENIDICQDAVDLDIATDAEHSALTAWRKYRVLLNRVDCTTAPDIEWPELPK